MPFGRDQSWLVLGTSPSHQKWYERLSHARGDMTVITTNNGIETCPAPDYYWISDPRAWRRHREQIEPMRRSGTLVVTSKHLPGIAQRADVAVDVPVGFPPEQRSFERGRYANGRTSGSIMVQFAVNSGAWDVHIVGCEGWGTEKPRIMQWYVPLMKSIVRRCPDVRFTFYGDLKYAVSGDNVEIIRDLRADVLHA